MHGGEKNRVSPGPAALTGRSDDPLRVRTLRPVETEKRACIAALPSASHAEPYDT